MNDPGFLGRVVPRGWDRRVPVGGTVVMLRYPPGVPEDWDDQGVWRFEHWCDRKTSARGVVVCAPLLSPAHTVTETKGRIPSDLTVNPSILCPDCNLHGWVRDGVWTPA